jgi:4-aminobutyrate aminotransferase-like enzyme
MTMINAYIPESNIGETERKLISRRERLLGPAYRLFYDNPVYFVRGEGIWLFDDKGDAYLDVYNNVASVGHCHPRVVAALANQAGVLNTHTRYLTDGILDYAERLLKHFPADLGHVMFTCTGSEANDLAYRVSQIFTGNTGVIVTKLAYHGATVATSQMSPSLGDAIELGPNIRTVPAPDLYRSSGGDVGEAFAADVRAAIADLETCGIRPAALLVDTIFSSDGVFPNPVGFLKPAVAAIREAGGVFIADEVQPGFGRTGDAFWGFQRHDLIPDLVTMGKPMGNGHPLAAMVARPEILEPFGKRTRYFNTFGGNPVSCAVGMAVLDVIETEGLVANAKSVGEFLRTGLQELGTRYELIGDVRGAGLFVGVELVTDRATRKPATTQTKRLVNGLREKRILMSATGPNANILKIRPPLVFSHANANQLLDALELVLAELC